VPPSRQAACQAYADFRDTRNTRATCGGFKPAANISAAWNRTRSRRARSTAVRPPPSGYLIPPDYTHPRRPRHPEAKTSVAWHYGNRAYGGYVRWRNRQEARVVGVGMAYIGHKYLGNRCRYRYGMRVCSGGRGLHIRAGTTLGTTYFTSYSSYVTPDRMRHERRHKRQWMRYGFRFAYMYLRAGVNACHNKRERRAGYKDGHYSECIH